MPALAAPMPASPGAGVVVREAAGAEVDRAGEVVASAYLADGLASERYAGRLRASRERAVSGRVVVAVDGSGRVVGSATYARGDSPLAELCRADAGGADGAWRGRVGYDAAEVRMLGVDRRPPAGGAWPRRSCAGAWRRRARTARGGCCCRPRSRCAPPSGSTPGWASPGVRTWTDAGARCPVARAAARPRERSHPLTATHRSGAAGTCVQRCRRPGPGRVTSVQRCGVARRGQTAVCRKVRR